MATFAPPPPPPPAAKKTSPLVWILAAVLGLFVLVALAAVAGGLFIAKKVHDVATNPAEAARLLVAANPDVEVVSTDSSGGSITVRDKRTGKVVTVNFDDLKKGKLSFEGDDGAKVSMQADDQGLQIKSSDGGTVTMGSGPAKMPNWLPAYPGGSEPKGAHSMQGADQQAGTVAFISKDPPAKILEFYDAAFKNAGFETHQALVSDSGGSLTGGSKDRKRSVVVNAGNSNEGTSVAIAYSAKK